MSKLFDLTYSWPMLPFISLENITKSSVLWCFPGEKSDVLQSDYHLQKRVVFICFEKSLLKIMLKALFVLEMLTFLSRLFGYAEKRFDKKDKVNL